ncbi:NADH-quinone oxidoreductase subunit B family protein [Persephonella sp.]
MKNLLWLQGLSCSGNSQSFLCSEEPFISDFFEKVNLLWHPEISYDTDLMELLRNAFENKIKIDFLIIEGSITKDKRFHRIGKYSIKYTINKLKHKVDYIIAVGNCAVHGNYPALYSKNPDVTGVQYGLNGEKGLLPKKFKTKSGYPVINITGCPVHPEWITKTVLSLVYGFPLKLDSLNRPKELYMYLSHDGCIRNEYFEWKVESEEFGTKEGCLFYNLGCRGPLTHAPCNKILWNGKSSKTRAGMPCIGCTEFNFPLRENYFKTEKNMGIPEEVPLGVTKRAYIMVTGMAKTFKNERLVKKLEETD